MDYTISGNDLILHQNDFNLDDIFNCGQAFRWTKIDNNCYSGSFLNSKLLISYENNNTFRLKNTSESDFLNIWYNYFDLSTNYSELKKRFSEDEILSKACKFGSGIRILRQDKWETLSSFIISQNNNIPRIKSIISKLCEHYQCYPSAQMLENETVESLDFLRCGFRAKYIIDAVNKIKSKEIVLEDISKQKIDNARKSLMTIKGVGPKVADCTLLFGMHKTEAFPIDVWMKRAVETWYPNGLPDCIKGFEGIAQQYLFHYIRNIQK